MRLRQSVIKIFNEKTPALGEETLGSFNGNIEGNYVFSELGHSLIEASAWVRKNPSVQGGEAGAKVYSIQREEGCIIITIMLHRSNASAAIKHFAFTWRNANHTAFSL